MQAAGFVALDVQTKTSAATSTENLTTLEQWLEHISHQHTAEIEMGLERVREVWQRMRCPQAPVNIIVGGTNGKGSTCAMLESILHVGGYKTGFFTSPHLLRYNERVRVDKAEASDAMLIASFRAIEASRSVPNTIPLTYFEYGALSALWIFAHQNIEVAILEVGLGGRLDAVNIIDADVSVVAIGTSTKPGLWPTRKTIDWRPVDREVAPCSEPGRALGSPGDRHNQNGPAPAESRVRPARSPPKSDALPGSRYSLEATSDTRQRPRQFRRRRASCGPLPGPLADHGRNADEPVPKRLHSGAFAPATCCRHAGTPTVAHAEPMEGHSWAADFSFFDQGVGMSSRGSFSTLAAKPREQVLA